MPLLDPSMFGSGDYGDQPGAYPNTSLMGLLTGASIPPGSMDEAYPRQSDLPWGRTVSLEGGLGPGSPGGTSAAPDRGASPAGSPAAGRSDRPSYPRTSYGLDDETSPSGLSGSILSKFGDIFGKIGEGIGR